MKQKKSVRQVRRDDGVHVFRLYVAGNERNSQIARENLKRICDEHLDSRCEIEEVDILKDYAVAMRERVFVTPTLVLLSPEPRTSVVGNLSDEEKVVSALRLGR